MAFSIGELSATVTADDGKFMSSMNEVRSKGARAAEKVQHSFRKAGRRMQSIGMNMSAAITAPLAGAGAMAIKTSADYETLRVSMDALNGSAEEGARNFERLKDFSAETPFQLKDLAKTQNMLQGFGLEADHAFESLSMIGDIAAITGANIRDIGRVFGKSAAEGRLMTEEILQLVDNSVPAFKLLAETMEVPQSQIRSLAEEGKISFDILQEAFRNATSEGGTFEDGMQELSETTHGLFSTLRDAVNNALADIGDSITKTFDIKGLIRSLTESIQSGIKVFNSLSKETREMAFTMAGVLGASGPIIAALGTLSLAIGAISAPIAGIATAFAVTTAAVISNWDEVVSYFTAGQGAGIFESIKGLADSLHGAVTRIWDLMGDELIHITKGAFKAVKATFETGFDALSLALDVFTGRWATDWDGFWSDNEDRVRRFSKNIVDIFLDTGKEAENAFGKLVIDTENMTIAWEKASDKVSDVGSDLDNTYGIMKAGNSVTEAATGYINSLATGYGVMAVNARQAAAAQREANNASRESGKSSVSTETKAIKAADVSAASFMNTLSLMNPKLDVMANGLEIAKGAASSVSEAMKVTKKEVSKAAQAGGQFGQMMGNALSQAVLHANSLLDTLKNLAKQLASKVITQGLTMLLSGGTMGGGGLIGSLIGGIFHSGGIVGGSGDQPIMAEGGEGVFTKGQMKAMGGLIRGGGNSMNERKMSHAFEMALGKHLQKLGPEEIYSMSRKGQFTY